MLNKAIVALGANLGNTEVTLSAAVEALRASEGIAELKVSRFYTTSPVDSSGPDYLNAVASLKTSLSPDELLRLCQHIENVHGRVRPAGIVNAPRTLDLDVIDYEGIRQTVPHLILPHPRMHQRLFVLVPMQEVCPDWTFTDGRGLPELIAEVEKNAPDQKIRLHFSENMA